MVLMRLILALISVLGCLLLAMAQDSRPTFRARPLLAGDRIEVTLLGIGEAPFQTTIQSDGTVRLPHIGSVVLGGSSVAEAAKSVERAFAEAGKPAQAVLRRADTKDHPIGFTGAFRKAGSVQAWRSATLGSLLDLAVPTDRADLENVEVWGLDGSLTYADASLPDSPARSMKLRPGDAVFMPELRSVPQITVLGAVAKPGVVGYIAGMTARQAIEAAGGLSNRADGTKVRIERDKKPVDTVNVSLNYDAPLKAGDVVIVPMRPEPQFVSISGGVKKPGLVDFREGMTLSDAIQEAGGTTPLADLGKITILRRVDGSLKREKADLNQIRAGKQPDIVLLANDAIDIPEKKPAVPATNPPGGGGGGDNQEPVR